MKPLSLHRWLGQGRDPLWVQGRHLLAWQAALSHALPSELRGAVLVAGWHDGVLQVVCSSGAAAARLRQAAPQVAKALAAEGEVHELRVKVAPHLVVVPPARTARAPLSEAAVAALEQAAQRLEEGPLKARLVRMIAHQRGTVFRQD